MSTGLFDLSGRVAVVTGASRGLGAAASHALATAGAHVVLIGREQATLESRAHAIRGGGGLHGLPGRATPIVCDMSHPEEIITTVETIISRFEHIDILVNNAGIVRRSPAEDYSLDDWNDVLAVNLTGPFLMARQVGRCMIAQLSGRIINIASLLSFSGGLNIVGYTASKSAIAGLTRALANEWGHYNVQVNAIAPGYFHTEATAALQSDSERYNALLKRIPAGRWGDPDDLKGTILFLASDAAAYVNGQVIAVDGGWMAA